VPNQNQLVEEAYPTLPFYINDHGQDGLFNVTIASGSSVVSGGTVLGRVTATGLYTRYNNANSDGTEVARGILLNRVDPRYGNTLGSMMVHGMVRSGSLIGIDTAGVTDLQNKIHFT